MYFSGRPDIDPVAAVDVGDERIAALDQRREILPLDRPVRTGRDPVERLGFQDINTSVDRVAGDLIGAWLLEKTPHITGFTCLYQAVCRRVLHGRQHDRGSGVATPMEIEHGPKVGVSEDIPVEDDDGAVDAA